MSYYKFFPNQLFFFWKSHHEIISNDRLALRMYFCLYVCKTPIFQLPSMIHSDFSNSLCSKQSNFSFNHLYNLKFNCSYFSGNSCKYLKQSSISYAIPFSLHLFLKSFINSAFLSLGTSYEYPYLS